jgi:hypothetical protein
VVGEGNEEVGAVKVFVRFVCAVFNLSKMADIIDLCQSRNVFFEPILSTADFKKKKKNHLRFL